MYHRKVCNKNFTMCCL